MKTLLIANNYSCLDIDFESQTVEQVEGSREAISRVYLVNEDCIVKYNNTERHAKSGDIIVVFYENNFENKFVVVTSEDWKNNIETYNKKMADAQLKCSKAKCECCDDSCCKSLN